MPEPPSASPVLEKEETPETDDNSASPPVEASNTLVASAGEANGATEELQTVSPLEAVVDSAHESRPRSPKPEADGKLDRGFKFPTSSPPADEQAAVTGVGSKAQTSAASDAEAQAEDNGTSGSGLEHALKRRTSEEAVQAASSDQPPPSKDASKSDDAQDRASTAEPEKIESAVPPSIPEPKKTDPDVDAAARQWLSGQKPVDASGDLEGGSSSKVLEQVLETKAASEAEKQVTEVGNTTSTQEPEALEAISNPVQSGPEPTIEVQKEGGDVASVDEVHGTQLSRPEVPEIEVQKNEGNDVEIVEEKATAPDTVPDAVTKEAEEEVAEQAGPEDANDDEPDETPDASGAQTPAESPIIVDGSAPVGGGKKRKNKKKNKK